MVMNLTGWCHQRSGDAVIVSCWCQTVGHGLSHFFGSDKRYSIHGTLMITLNWEVYFGTQWLYSLICKLQVSAACVPTTLWRRPSMVSHSFPSLGLMSELQIPGCTQKPTSSNPEMFSLAQASRPSFLIPLGWVFLQLLTLFPFLSPPVPYI